MNGFILIDKPSGISSHQALTLLKRKIKPKKLGHTGTLDPFATGLLVVGLDEAVKFIPYLNEEPKVYEATLKLGTATDTLDLTGKIIDKKPVIKFSREEILKRVQPLLGKRKQKPPMFSAKKQNGKRLYELARKGIEVEREPVDIFITSLEIVEVTLPLIRFRVACSKGTYIRVLGVEMAHLLKTVGQLTNLRRLQAGPYKIDAAVKPKGRWYLNDSLISMNKALDHLPQIELDDLQLENILHGQPIQNSTLADNEEFVRLMHSKKFLGVGQKKGVELWPKRLIADVSIK